MSDAERTAPALSSATPSIEKAPTKSRTEQFDAISKPRPNTSARPSARKRHIAPVKRIDAAREMGVQYLADCGRWAWPSRPVTDPIHTPRDLTPDMCKDCSTIWLRWWSQG